MGNRIILVHEYGGMVYTGEVDSFEVGTERNKFRISGEGRLVTTHTIDWLADYIDQLGLTSWNKEEKDK